MVDRSASTSSLPVTHGPETQMLNLKILQNLSQSNIYRDEKSKEGVRSLEKTLLGEGPRYTHRQAALAAGMDPRSRADLWCVCTSSSCGHVHRGPLHQAPGRRISQSGSIALVADRLSLSLHK